jgi:hypothetical protein
MVQEGEVPHSGYRRKIYNNKSISLKLTMPMEHEEEVEHSSHLKKLCNGTRGGELYL